MRSKSTFLRGSAALLLIATLSAVPAYSQKVVTVAVVGEADTFDPMVSTKDIVSQVTQHFVETLYTFDGSWNVAPLLAAEMPDISAGGTVYRIPLREGIMFHDGSMMDSGDVAASIMRWLEVASRGKGIADRVTSVEATGPLEVTITLSSPHSPLLSLLAFSNSAAVVYPEEIIGETIDEVIGTGPYRIGEHVPDLYLQLLRFDGYVSRSEPSDGHAGARKQIPDEIRFIPVADPNTRVEGLVSGQFDFADALPAESYSRIEGSDIAEPLLLQPFGWPVWAINHKAGLLTDQKVRLALQAALPIDDMLFAAFGDERFFLVDAPLFPSGWVWNNDAGVEYYNQNDPEAARALLDEAGYTGQPLRILTSRQFEFHFKMAEVARVALEDAGFTVQMDVVDWATLGQRRNDPALFDLYITHSPFLPEPALTSLWSVTARTGWGNPEKEAVLAEFTAETDLAKRRELFAELQRMNFEDVGFIKIGGFNALMGQREGLAGVPANPWPFFWNASVM
ncbi:MAG: ABC transporter substrate-binding protein [Rhodobacteraceae bacterium]|nr:ABC transporter substrate-binding protein [Paracoccaceae bacterium]